MNLTSLLYNPLECYVGLLASVVIFYYKNDSVGEM